LGSIVPIIEILIREFKSEKDLGKLKIKHIIDYLVSQKVLSLPKPYYVNHTLTSVFKNTIKSSLIFFQSIIFNPLLSNYISSFFVF
jgi:hypothetical protein